MVDAQDVAATIANFEPPSSHANGKEGRKALDMSHHLSMESTARRPSPLKEASLYRKCQLGHCLVRLESDER